MILFIPSVWWLVPGAIAYPNHSSHPAPCWLLGCVGMGGRVLVWWWVKSWKRKVLQLGKLSYSILRICGGWGAASKKKTPILLFDNFHVADTLVFTSSMVHGGRPADTSLDQSWNSPEIHRWAKPWAANLCMCKRHVISHQKGSRHKGGYNKCSWEPKTGL